MHSSVPPQPPHRTATLPPPSFPPGVQPTEFSPSDLAFAWGTNETFANQTLALEAFLSVLAEVDIVIDETFVADPSTYHLGEFLMQFSSEGVFPTAEDVWFSAGKVSWDLWALIGSRACSRGRCMVGCLSSCVLEALRGATARLLAKNTALGTGQRCHCETKRIMLAACHHPPHLTTSAPPHTSRSCARTA